MQTRYWEQKAKFIIEKIRETVTKQWQRKERWLTPRGPGCSESSLTLHSAFQECSKIPQWLTPHLCFSTLLICLLENLLHCLQLLDFPPIPTKQVCVPPRIPPFNSKEGYLTDAPQITGNIYCSIFTMITGQVMKGMEKSSRNFSTLIFGLMYSLTNHTSLEQCLARGMLLWSILTINILTQIFLNEYIIQ